jgi:formylglycine-generating enzyme required for sulfatase activity
MKLVLVPAGKFTMGSPKTEVDHRDDEMEHQVEITKPFYMGTCKVTQQQYLEVMGKNPSWYCADGSGFNKVKCIETKYFPVENVSWNDIHEFLRKLNALDKKKGMTRAYRLPTEAEWEYACREAGKSRTPFHYGEKLSFDQANFNGDFPYAGGKKGPHLGRPAPVASYKPNKLGLFDMHGNGGEWCSDWYDEDYYSKSPKKDPQGPQTGRARVIRGGSWGSEGRYCRSASRAWNPPDEEHIAMGFRVVCPVPPPAR